MKAASTNRHRGGFLDRMRGRQREFSRRSREWLRTRPWLHRLLEATGCLRRGPEAMARGVGVGLLIGLTPTVGFQTPLMIIGCMLVGGNFIAAFMVSWVSNPFTMGPMYWGFHSLGTGLFTLLPPRVGEPPESTWVFSGLGDEVLFAAVGSLLVAVPAGVIGYLVSHRISAALAARRRRRDASRSGS